MVFSNLDHQGIDAGRRFFSPFSGLVFINMDTYADPFDAWIGGLPQKLGSVEMSSFEYKKSLTFNIRSNWKVYVENYCEGYHIQTAHPTLDAMIESKKYSVSSFSPKESRVEKFAIHSAPQRSGSPSGGLWLYMFPNWALNIYSWGMDVEVMTPISPTVTQLELHYYSKIGQDAQSAEKQLQELVETSKVIVGEDISLCEAVQKNLEAGIYQRGVLCKERENGVHDFKIEYLKLMKH